MKKLASMMLLAVAFTVGGISNAEPFDPWHNRPAVIRAAEVLADEVERLDTALHNIHAPDPVIQVAHHFEETVMEFVDEVRGGCTYQHAYQEMNHIRQDVGLLRDKFAQYPQLLHNPAVYTEWRHVRTAYRNLDHEMFHWAAGRWNSAAVASLKKDMAELEASHANE